MIRTVAYNEAIKKGEAVELETVEQFDDLKQRIDTGRASEAECLTWELQSPGWRATVERNGPILRQRAARRRLEIRICGDPVRRFYEQEGCLPRGIPAAIRAPRAVPASTRRPSCSTRRRSSSRSSSSSGDDGPEPEPPGYRRSTFLLAGRDRLLADSLAVIA